MHSCGEQDDDIRHQRGGKGEMKDNRRETVQMRVELVNVFGLQCELVGGGTIQEHYNFEISQ